MPASLTALAGVESTLPHTYRRESSGKTVMRTTIFWSGRFQAVSVRAARAFYNGKPVCIWPISRRDFA
jgi:hypothetical protein